MIRILRSDTRKKLCGRRGILSQTFHVGTFVLSVALFGAKATAQHIASTPKSQGPAHGDANNGKRLYHAYGCYECHGGQGQGSPLSGPRIAPEPTQFSAFVRYIRKPSGQMPPYTSEITSDAGLTDIYAFLQSIPHPPDPSKIPLLASPAGPEKRN